MQGICIHGAVFGELRFTSPIWSDNYVEIGVQELVHGWLRQFLEAQAAAELHEMGSLRTPVAALENLIPHVDGIAMEHGKEWPQLLALVADGSSADTLYTRQARMLTLWFKVNCKGPYHQPGANFE